MNVETKRELLVVSAELATATPRANMERTLELEDWLKVNNYAYTKALGCYKGVEESSFIVEVPKGFRTTALLNVVYVDFNQEAVTFINEARKVSLWKHDGDVKLVGFLRGVTAAEAWASDNWTYNYHNRTYYVAG